MGEQVSPATTLKPPVESSDSWGLFLFAESGGLTDWRLGLLPFRGLAIGGGCGTVPVHPATTCAPSSRRQVVSQAGGRSAGSEQRDRCEAVAWGPFSFCAVQDAQTGRRACGSGCVCRRRRWVNPGFVTVGVGLGRLGPADVQRHVNVITVALEKASTRLTAGRGWPDPRARR